MTKKEIKELSEKTKHRFFDKIEKELREFDNTEEAKKQDKIFEV